MSRKNRRLLRIAAPIVGALLALASARPAPAHAQQDDPVARCEARGGSNGAAQCETRTYTLPATRSLTVDASPNGGVTVVASDRSDIRVTARLRASAPTEAEASEILSDLRVETDGGVVRADGPERLGNRRGWSVSFEILVPRSTSLDVESVNGGVSVRGTTASVTASTVNGGITLREVNGTVRGSTTNGGIDVTLSGDRWQGESLDLGTTNGGITLRVPSGFNARLVASTVHGDIDTDFPLTIQGRVGRRVEGTLGSGGPTVRLSTTNGGIRLLRD